MRWFVKKALDRAVAVWLRVVAVDETCCLPLHVLCLYSCCRGVLGVSVATVTLAAVAGGFDEVVLVP